MYVCKSSTSDVSIDLLSLFAAFLFQGEVMGKVFAFGLFSEGYWGFGGVESAGEKGERVREEGNHCSRARRTGRL